MPPFRTAKERLSGRIPTRHRMPTTASRSDASGAWALADGSGAGLALIVHYAHWFRIGNLIFAFFAVTYPATASGAVASFTPPVLAKSHAVEVYGQDFAQTNAALTRFAINDLGTLIKFYDSTGTAYATNAGMSTKRIAGTAIYEVA